MARRVHIELDMNATQKMARNIVVGDKLHGCTVTAVVLKSSMLGTGSVHICRGGQWVVYTAYACVTMG